MSFHVIGSTPQRLRRVFELAEPEVAPVAEQSPHLVGGVAVIDVEEALPVPVSSPSGVSSSADCASMTLSSQHPGVVVEGKSVVSLQLVLAICKSLSVTLFLPLLTFFGVLTSTRSVFRVGSHSLDVALSLLFSLFGQALWVSTELPVTASAVFFGFLRIRVWHPILDTESVLFSQAPSFLRPPAIGAA